MPISVDHTSRNQRLFRILASVTAITLLTCSQRRGRVALSIAAPEVYFCPMAKNRAKGRRLANAFSTRDWSAML